MLDGKTDERIVDSYVGFATVTSVVLGFREKICKNPSCVIWNINFGLVL